MRSVVLMLCVEREAGEEVAIRQKENATTIQGREDIQIMAVAVKVIRSGGGFCI